MVVERREKLVAVHVLHRLGAEVDAVVEELLDQVAEDVGLDQGRDLVAELELVEDLLDVGRKAVQIRFEIGLEPVSYTHLDVYKRQSLGTHE